MLDLLTNRGMTKTDILHTAESLFHDHVPAKAIGSPPAGSTAATHRGSARRWTPALGPSTDFRFNSMAELARGASAGDPSEGVSPATLEARTDAVVIPVTALSFS